jgi:hypothetical protein
MVCESYFSLRDVYCGITALTDHLSLLYSGFVIARKLLRRRHITKERRERREEQKNVALERKRQRCLESKVETRTDCPNRIKSSHCVHRERANHNLSSPNCGERGGLIQREEGLVTAC